MEILDYHLRDYLQRELGKLPANLQIQTKTLRSCGHRLVPAKVGSGGAFVVSNGKSAKLIGVSSCKNSYACPTCSAIRMSKYANEIGVAIDELEKRGYQGIMVTLTIPHLDFMYCKETFDILFNAYIRFRTSLRQHHNKGKIMDTPGSRFTREVGLKHTVSVCEFTWGKNGWHPHFHSIFWVPRKNLQKAAEYEKVLHEKWMYYAKLETIKYWKKHRTLKDAEKTAEWMYSIVNQTRGGLYFSKTEDGKIRAAQSSDYICGWGTNRELTGNYRKSASHDGHLTPYQILEKAANGDEFYKGVYIDFVLAITAGKHRRIIWSQTGIKGIVKVGIQQNKCRELIKKKESESQEWKVLCWFTREEWSYINDLSRNSPVISNILYLATKGTTLLYEFLNGLGIRYELPETNYFTSHIENIASGNVA